jgi:hypothetical protein
MISRCLIRDANLGCFFVLTEPIERLTFSINVLKIP